MEQLEQLGTGEDGNSVVSSPVGKYRNFCFTINNYSEDDLRRMEKLKIDDKVKLLVCQEETGTKGTPHLQGYIELQNPRSFSGVGKTLGGHAHIEVSRNRDASIKYCMKEDTRTGKTICKGVLEPLETLKDEELYPWELEVLRIINTKPDHRSIYWFWEERGNEGKSCFGRYLTVKKDALLIGGKAADVKCAVATEVNDNHRNPKIVIYDVVRDMESYMSYQALEEVKNACFFSGKYASAQCTYNYCHVFVFANFPPETHRLSQDRWKIYYINPDHTAILKTADAELSDIV